MWEIFLHFEPYYISNKNYKIPFWLNMPLFSICHFYSVLNNRKNLEDVDPTAELKSIEVIFISQNGSWFMNESHNLCAERENLRQNIARPLIRNMWRKKKRQNNFNVYCKMPFCSHFARILQCDNDSRFFGVYLMPVRSRIFDTTSHQLNRNQISQRSKHLGHIL